MVPGSEPAVQVYPGTPFDCVNSWDCHYLLFYGRAYDMVVSYTIRQEQDRSAERAVDRRIYSESPGCKRRDFFP